MKASSIRRGRIGDASSDCPPILGIWATSDESEQDRYVHEQDYGRFKRRLRLPDRMDSESIVATYDRGRGFGPLADARWGRAEGREDPDKGREGPGLSCTALFCLHLSIMPFRPPHVTDLGPTTLLSAVRST